MLLFNPLSLPSFIVISLSGAMMGSGFLFLLLYFLRDQRETALFVYGLTGIVSGIRINLPALSSCVPIAPEASGTLNSLLFLFSAWLLLLSQLSLRPCPRKGLLSFLSGCAAAASAMAVLSPSFPFSPVSLLMAPLLLFSLFGAYQILIVHKEKGRAGAPLSVFLLSLAAHALYLRTLSPEAASPIRFLGNALLFMGTGLIMFFENQHIAQYFNDVEDLTYSLRVTNASLKKSEDLIRKKNDELHHQANHDFLTDLPNRMSLYHMTNTTLQSNYRKNHKVGFLLMDLDRFKQLNDTMGHSMGDLLLTKFAQIIRSTLRNTDQLYRLGGDEFTVMVSEIHHVQDLQTVVEKIYKSLEEPIRLGDINYRVSSSMGVALYPDHGGDIDTLLGRADIALYVAKEEGRNRAVFFNDTMQNRSDDYFSLRKRLSDALEKNEFSLVFQPQYELEAPGDIFGFESLVRLGDGSGGFIPPSLFIPIAEDSGFILPLGNWILDRTLHITRNWVRENPSLKISVNISASQFRSSSFISDLVSLLDKNGFPPENLVLELTENLALNRDDRTLELISRIRSMGIEIAIDDFGTGFSSLNYLKEFPLDHIKIDKSFVQDLPHSKPDNAIVRSIIEMADSLGMKVIAEGVEREEQYSFLWGKGCQIVQGYFTGKPLPEHEAAGLFRKKRTCDKKIG